MIYEIINYEMFDCVEYAQLQRIEQLDKIIEKDYKTLEILISKGRIHSHIGYYIQYFQKEKENILSHSSLITEHIKNEVMKQKCQKILKNSLNKKQKNLKQLTYKVLEIALKQQSLKQNPNKTHEEMKRSILR